MSDCCYQLPEDPPPPDDPPPPEKLLPPELQDLPELPELKELPDLPDENAKPPIEALPFVFKSFSAFLYQLVCFIKILTAGNAIR